MSIEKLLFCSGFLGKLYLVQGFRGIPPSCHRGPWNTFILSKSSVVYIYLVQGFHGIPSSCSRVPWDTFILSQSPVEYLHLANELCGIPLFCQKIPWNTFILSTSPVEHLHLAQELCGITSLLSKRFVDKIHLIHGVPWNTFNLFKASVFSNFSVDTRNLVQGLPGTE